MLEFVLNWVPNMVFHLLVILGILAVIVSFFTPKLMFGPYETVAQFAAVLILSVGLFFEGALSNERNWQYKIAEAEKHIAELMVESEQANVKLVEQLAENERIQAELQHATRTEIVRVEKVINKGCTVAPDAIRVLNSAIKGPAKGNATSKKHE